MMSPSFHYVKVEVENYYFEKCMEMNSNSLHKNRTIDVPKGSSAYPNTPSTRLRIMIK